MIGVLAGSYAYYRDWLNEEAELPHDRYVYLRNLECVRGLRWEKIISLPSAYLNEAYNDEFRDYLIAHLMEPPFII